MGRVSPACAVHCLIYTRPKISSNKCEIHACQVPENCSQVHYGTDFEGRCHSSYQNNHIAVASLKNVRYCCATAGSHPTNTWSWSLKSTYAAASTRFFLTDQVRFRRRTHIWGFDWSCTGNIRDIKLYGLLRSDRNELCICRRGVRRHHCGKGRELRRGWVREHLKFCNRLVCKDSNQLVRTKERKQNGSSVRELLRASCCTLYSTAVETRP